MHRGHVFRVLTRSHIFVPVQQRLLLQTRAIKNIGGRLAGDDLSPAYQQRGKVILKDSEVQCLVGLGRRQFASHNKTVIDRKLRPRVLSPVELF